MDSRGRLSSICFSGVASPDSRGRLSSMLNSMDSRGRLSSIYFKVKRAATVRGYPKRSE